VKAVSGCLVLSLAGCSMFSPKPDPLPWTGQIETFAPGAEVSLATLSSGNEEDGEQPVDGNQLPEGLVGPNPKGAAESLLTKALNSLPGAEAVPTEAVPVQSVSTGSQPSFAEQDATGWIWDDRATKWQLTAKQVPQADEWLYEAEALLFRLSSPTQLNVFEGSSHATVVKILQLDNPKAFNTLRQDPFGLADMLTQNALDASFLVEKKLYMMPDDNVSLVMDREEGVRYVGIIAGYYELTKYKQVSRLIQIPAVVESLETGTLSKLWPLSKEPTLQRPARLKFWVQLGEQSLDSVAIQVN